MNLTKPQIKFLQDLADKKPVSRVFTARVPQNLLEKRLVGFSFIDGFWIKPEGLEALKNAKPN